MNSGCLGVPCRKAWLPKIKRAHELQKKVRNLPEPGRVVELLLKNISEQYHVPLDDKKTEGQQEAAESEEDNGE